VRRLPIAAYFTPRHQDCRVARRQLRMRFLVAQGSASPCRGRPPWLPIRFERGHAVASRANSVPQGRKKIAPAFNPRIRVTHTSGSVRDKRRRDSRRVRIESRRDGKKIAPGFNPRIRVTHTSGSVRDKRRRDSRRVRIESRRDGKKIAPGFNPGINVAPRSSPVGTTESASGPRCIWVHIRSRAV